MEMDEGLKQPNILLITTDEQRFDTYGSQGSEWPQTPNINRLRREGVTLANAYSTSPGTILPGLVESIDLPHTILDAAGLDEDARLRALPESPGKSFWSYAKEGGAEFREDVFAEYGDSSGRSTMRMLRHGDWKFTRISGHDLLFNLKDDPDELKNLALNPDEAEKLREMQGRLIDRMALVRQPPIQGRSANLNSRRD